MNTVLIAFALNLLVMVPVKFMRLLTLSGLISAVLVGAIIYTFTGLEGWLILMFFFVSANVIGKVAKRIYPLDLSDIHKKGGTRDWAQVVANGGIAAVSALLFGLTGTPYALVLFGAALAASTADTWASEAGILSSKDPVSIITFRRVRPGMSGGVSILGSLSSMLGSILVALLWYVSYAVPSDSTYILLASVVAVSGILGSLVDSILGATLQGHYWDPVKQMITEKERDKDGNKLELCRGIRWIDNDVVNLVSNVISVLLGASFSIILL